MFHRASTSAVSVSKVAFVCGFQVHAHIVQHNVPAGVRPAFGDSAQSMAGGFGLSAGGHCRCISL